jgi:hypothetical protein
VENVGGKWKMSYQNLCFLEEGFDQKAGAEKVGNEAVAASRRQSNAWMYP